jgi:choice-of-anchor B domain-containing protein
MLRPLVLAGIAAALGACAPTVRAQAPCVSGTATLGGVTYACSGVDLMAVVSPQALGAPAAGACPSPYPDICANDVWGWTDATTGREYALVGLVNGTAFVDVTVPAAPVLLGRMPTRTDNSSWRDVEVYADHAFVVSEASGHGMQVFDLRRLRGLTANAARVFTPTTVYTRIGSAHTVAINTATGFAYPVGFRTPSGETGLPAACAVRGVHAVDVRTPAAPVFSTCFNDAAQETGPRTPGYTHDMVCQIYAGPDTQYVGREMCFASNEDVLTVFDVTDKTNVVTVSQGSYPGTGYTHQGWFAEGQRYFLVNDELDERNGTTPSQRTIVMDLLDLDDPEFAYAYTSGLPVVDHNLYVNGRYAFESNYEAGLRVLDLAGVATGTITEAAFFDTYPQGQSANFNGQWANYPFFASGNVVASDVRNGLFVLRPTAILPVSVDGPADAAVGSALSEPVPNPTSGGTRLTLTVGAAQAVTAEVFDVTGRRVATAFAGPAAPGAPVQIDVDTSALTPGVYVVRVAGERFAASRRVAVTR